MTAYYNEIDPYAAQWLRNLIKAGHIADGEVDERSITDVAPADLKGFTQCHFFAGIGVWSLALRRAGWSDDRPVWTGSCPCQPFSAAGKGNGFADERHLWPAFHHLIRQCKPPVVFGEQVASKDAEPWLDLVQTDLEAMDYALGAVPFPAAGIGAPHIRDRLYWVAYSNQQQRDRSRDAGKRGRRELADFGSSIILADSDDKRLEGRAGMSERPHQCSAGENSVDGRLADTERSRIRACGSECSNDQKTGLQGIDRERQRIRIDSGPGYDGLASGQPPAGPTNGPWRDADWLLCRDGKWRPVEPGTSPLAHGSASRVGRLRAYGNAINAEAAKIFIEVAMGSLNAKP